MKKVLTLILSFALLCTLLFTFPAFGTSDESTVPTVFEEPVSETQTENETTPPPPPTTLSNAAPIPRAELNTNYAADIKSIASSNISHNELVELARQCSTAHITLDANDSCETVTFVGTGSTRTHLNITKSCEANKVVLIEFDGYATDTEYDPTLSTGGMVITEFLDSNQNLIGSKYNGSVLGKTRCGYHRYGYISPKGTRYLRVRFATRGSTTIMLKNFSLEVLNQYQKRNNDNGIIYDGHLGMTLAAPKTLLQVLSLQKSPASAQSSQMLI